MKKQWNETKEEGDLGERAAKIIYQKMNQHLVNESDSTEYDLMFLDGFKFSKKEVKTDLYAMEDYKAFPIEVGDSYLKGNYKHTPTTTAPDGTIIAKTGVLATTADEMFFTDTFSYFIVEMWKIKEYVRNSWNEVKHFTATNGAYGVTISVDRLKQISKHYHIDKQTPMDLVKMMNANILNNITEDKT